MGTVAIVGPGSGGTAVAVDLALLGHEVRVWGRNEDKVAPLAKEDIRLEGVGRAGTARVALATTDLEAAVKGCDLVFVTVPGFAHSEIARALARELASGQAVVLMPASFGSFEVVRALHEQGKDGVLVGETATLPYGARRPSPTHVIVPLRAARLPLGVFPGARCDELVELARDYYEVIEPTSTLLDAGLLNPNVPIHTALMATNAGPIEAFDAYDIHAQGTTEATRRVIDALDAERITLREALGYGPPHFEQSTFYDAERQGEGLFGPAARDLVEKSGEWKEKLSLQHRYVTEDAAQGLSLHVSLGEALGVDVPISRGVLHLNHVLSGLDFAPQRTLGTLGLDGYGGDDLNRLLMHGW